jgi:hypothetical protein
MLAAIRIIEEIPPFWAQLISLLNNHANFPRFDFSPDLVSWHR